MEVCLGQDVDVADAHSEVNGNLTRATVMLNLLVFKCLRLRYGHDDISYISSLILINLHINNCGWFALIWTCHCLF